MILQNLAKAVREQNYYAVVLEFLIVIAGVVIGFQIQGWAEAARSEAEVDNVLTRLQAESEEVVDYWISDITYGVDTDRNFVWFLNAIKSGTIEAGRERDFERALVELSFFSDIYPPRTVFDELLSSGGLSLISDPHAKTALSEYTDTLTFIRGQTEQFRQLVPDLLRAYEGYIFSELAPDRPTLRRYEYDIDLLSENRQFYSKMVDYVSYQRAYLYFRIDALNLAIGVCEALSAAQASECSNAQEARELYDQAKSYLDGRNGELP